MPPSEIRQWDVEDIAECLAMNELEPLFDPWVANALLSAYFVQVHSKEKVNWKDFLPYKTHEPEGKASDVTSFFANIQKQREVKASGKPQIIYGDKL